MVDDVIDEEEADEEPSIVVVQDKGVSAILFRWEACLIHR